ncbi:Major facilitator superfamily domain-containing protein 1 [Grifola frondosa]|uniref:Lysosomal dipeptide transporter MFSD1 n=1 Tax=Grifola frondosa TaxID=5627 RepID=A0A1C7MRY5_GRIFR|nr:Major facilitator superfamily domain-containing protein 1 [Grifola frondosa]
MAALSGIISALPLQLSLLFGNHRLCLYLPSPASKMRQRRSAIRANYHPFLFTLMTLTATAELGLTAFLISAGNEVHTWASPGYHSLLILLCFSSAWTLIFSAAYVLWIVDGAVHILAQVASSVFWLLLTSILWGTAAGIMHNTRTGGDCPERAPISRCRQSLTVEALGWTEFSLCCLVFRNVFSSIPMTSRWKVHRRCRVAYCSGYPRPVFSDNANVELRDERMGTSSQSQLAPLVTLPSIVASFLALSPMSVAEVPVGSYRDIPGSEEYIDEDGVFVTAEDVESLRLDSNGGNPSPARAHIVRGLALLCACSLSIGSHYATYILGPLKSQLSREMGTDNTEFSLLLSAFSLNSTWTPLVAGVLASRLGTTFTSILATGAIFLGQAFLLIGNLSNSVRLMTFGMFIFGLGVSPLAVVQETIIVRFFRSHGLGVSLALGLVAGKGASFVSARTAYPLSQRFGPHAPFYAATLLAALSFIVNLVYLFASKWLIRGAGAELEASELHAEAHSRSGSIMSLSEAEALKEVANKRMVYLRDITKLGDVFWAYIGLNVICGAIWSPFTHLVANIIERRYELTESDASTKASYVLAGSVILYPITGYVVDRVKKRGTVLQFLMVSAVLTLLSSFATGHGFATLLLVIIVPQIVPLKYVSTTLGAHKALEQTGSTIFQTTSGRCIGHQVKEGGESAGIYIWR